jgi:hypothetical protein
MMEVSREILNEGAAEAWGVGLYFFLCHAMVLQ